jgi:alpha-galactosidase
MTDSPNWVNNRTTSVEYRFLSSVQGSMGVGANLDKWTPDDFAVAKDMIAAYKPVRETVPTRLSLSAHLPAGKQRIFRDGVCLARQAAGCPLHLSALQSEGYPFPRVYLHGLDPTRQYHLRFIHSAKALDALEVASGSY